MAKTRNKTVKRASEPSKVANARPAGRIVRAGYDAARTTDDNKRRWSFADALGPNAAANAQVRRMLRNRCRYECANNSYAAGIVNTVGNDTVGIGPRLQMQTDSDRLNTAIEIKFGAWAEEIGLGSLLRTARMARHHSGESFGIIGTNLGLESPVKIDLKQVEPDLLPGNLDFRETSNTLDGIEYDQWGNPKVYHFLDHHPGDTSQWANFDISGKTRPIAAKYVLHYFRKERPGQLRGIPELTPSLSLFSEMRAYTKAVVAAAETAADFAAVVYSEVGADPDEQPDPFDVVELEKRMATVLPAGYKLGQIRAEQPTSTYGDFIWTLLREIARCLNVPLTVAGLDSSKSNLSAAYLDQMIYAKAILIDRYELERLLNRLLDIWLTEAIRAKEIETSRISEFKRKWFWPQIGTHADPSKVASAQKMALANGTTSLAIEYAKLGLDWETEIRVAAKCLGISVEEYQGYLRNSIFNIQVSPFESDEETDNSPSSSQSRKSKQHEEFSEE